MKRDIEYILISRNSLGMFYFVSLDSIKAILDLIINLLRTGYAPINVYNERTRTSFKNE